MQKNIVIVVKLKFKCDIEHLSIFLISDSLETFDEAITNWQDYPYTIAVDVIFYPEEDYIRPNNVPISHVWWKNQ